MRIGISNIAWPASDEERAADLLCGLRVDGVEVAPTKTWPDLLAVSDAEVERFRSLWERRGIRVIAAQALLYGRPELTLFGSKETRDATLAYLKEVVRLCAALGAGALVFGSPKNRRRGELELTEAWSVAIDFFAELGEAAVESGTAVVIEANPPYYGADFITRAADAIQLVRDVGSPGFRLHLDVACMDLAGDPPAETIASARDLLAHVHVSEPDLAPIGTRGLDHSPYAAALRAAGYGGWCSVEMRGGESLDEPAVRSALEHTRGVYGA